VVQVEAPSDAYLSLDVEVSFKPEAANGLLMYAAESPRAGNGDFVALGLRQGHPEFRFDLGSGLVVLSAEKPITFGQWHTIKVSRYATRSEIVNYIRSDGYLQNAK
jgi:dystroglycan 1